MFCLVFTRFAAHVLPKAFFMLLSFIFSYLESLFVVLYLSFIFYSCAGDQRARLPVRWVWRNVVEHGQRGRRRHGAGTGTRRAQTSRG